MTNLLELVKQYPNFPVYAWVQGEVCAGDEYAYWLGDMRRAYKTKITRIDRYYYDNDRVFEYDDRDMIFEYFCGQDENSDKTEEEIWAMVEALPWKECILVWVSTPDNL